MTKAEARIAHKSRLKVEAGKVFDDHDTGYIVSLKGSMAVVSWDGSRERTPYPISELSLAESKP